MSNATELRNTIDVAQSFADRVGVPYTMYALPGGAIVFFRDGDAAIRHVQAANGVAVCRLEPTRKAVLA